MRGPKPAEGGYATLYGTMKEVRAVGGYRIDSPTGPDFSTTEAKTDSFKWWAKMDFLFQGDGYRVNSIHSFGSGVHSLYHK